jgi:hypothetical protein
MRHINRRAARAFYEHELVLGLERRERPGDHGL